MDESLNNKSSNTTISKKEIQVENIFFSEKTLEIAAYCLGTENTEEFDALLRKQIQESEFLGVCVLTRFNSTGNLIKTKQDLYIIISLDFSRVIYVSNNLRDIKLLSHLPEHPITVDGEEYIFSKIELSHHFIKQASERFKINIDSVRDILFDIVVNGTYVCITHCKEYHKPAHLFCKDGRMVYISLDFKAAITAYSNPMNTSYTHEAIKEKIVELLISEIKRLSKHENRINKRITKEKLIANLRIAEIELALYNTISESKITQLQSELSTLKSLIENMDTEWIEVVDDIRRHAVTLSAFV